MIDSAALAERGYVVAPRLIEPDLCHSLAQIWPDQARFRSHIVMQRHGVGQGDAAIFAVNERPVKETRGFCRTAMRHGVSTVRRGQRFTLGITFRDAA